MILETLKHNWDVTTSTAASSLRAWRGTLVSGKPKQAELPLKLYDMEGCPYCRVVRETLTALQLDAEIYPCPKGGTRYREEAFKLTGAKTFPVLVDPNTGVKMAESADIVAYLLKTYSDGNVKQPKPLIATGNIASALRGLRGLNARPSNPPEKLLELYSFESSPYSRLVREVLCEMEIPYLLHNISKEKISDLGKPGFYFTLGKYQVKKGDKREAFKKQTGRLQFPYLVDPNTGTEMFESQDIIDYLEKECGE